MLISIAVMLSGCGAAALQVVPTARPTQTPTPTITTTPTPNRSITPAFSPTPPPPTQPGGPTVTPLFGQAAAAALPTVTPFNPNAPRIEFFTTDSIAVAPGSSVNLYWSTRGTTSANIYRLEDGRRNQVYPVGPDGNLSIPTRLRDRGTLDFVLSVGDGEDYVESTLSIPLACPDVWFFAPPPEACPDGPVIETILIEEPFERGRMLYITDNNTIYGLFNDGGAPGWIALENRFDPNVHPESEPSFVPPPGLYQPIRRLGFVWRGNDTVRTRLGLATQPEFNYDGFYQTATNTAGAVTLYVSSADGTVLQLIPGIDGANASWQIITPPS